MSQSVCVTSFNEISREGLCSYLSTEGFAVVAVLEEPSQISPEACEVGMLFILDSPPINQQRDQVESIHSIAVDPVIVILTEEFDLQTMLACFRAGARSYIVKSARAEPLMAALKYAATGSRVLPPDLIDLFDQQLPYRRSLCEEGETVDIPQFTPRELEVLCGLIAGYSNKAIAQELSVVEQTVKTHVKGILRKLGLRNRTQAAIWASSRGISGPVITSVDHLSDSTTSPQAA